MGREAIGETPPTRGSALKPTKPDDFKAAGARAISRARAQTRYVRGCLDGLPATIKGD